MGSNYFCLCLIYGCGKFYTHSKHTSRRGLSETSQKFNCDGRFGRSRKVPLIFHYIDLSVYRNCLNKFCVGLDFGHVGVLPQQYSKSPIRRRFFKICSLLDRSSVCFGGLISEYVFCSK